MLLGVQFFGAPCTQVNTFSVTKHYKPVGLYTVRGSIMNLNIIPVCDRRTDRNDTTVSHSA